MHDMLFNFSGAYLFPHPEKRFNFGQTSYEFVSNQAVANFGKDIYDGYFLRSISNNYASFLGGTFDRFSGHENGPQILFASPQLKHPGRPETRFYILFCLTLYH